MVGKKGKIKLIELHGKLDDIIEQLDSMHMYPSERKNDNFILTIWHSNETRDVMPHNNCKMCNRYKTILTKNKKGD
jgi:hypothetical protein